MCGITGFVDLTGRMGNDELRATANRMADALSHRGPDDLGAWADAEAGIALGHRRLSIIDLSPEGHQPMFSACDRYVIGFNGEVYNFLSIREELENLGAAPKWRGHSDTEVLLAAISHWGLEEALKSLVGMFAFVLWDQRNRILHLVRDRLGIKPLYYGWVGKTFLFGSELKALRAHPEFEGEIDRDTVALYLRHHYIPAPYSIYKGIYKLPPGTMLALNMADLRSEPQPKPYWSAIDAAERGVKEPFEGSDGEAIDQLDMLLQDAVRVRMIADVPLGALLSGGIDSSTVVGLMQAKSHRPVKTFTIGFRETGYNEAIYARTVAGCLGTDHTELYVTPEEARAVIPRLPFLYDEPFSDSSQIPTFLVSKMTQEHVKVALSGDGGDEIFGGYNRHTWAMNVWKATGWLPVSVRGLLGSVLASLSPHTWDRLFGAVKPMLPYHLRQEVPGDKIHKLAGVLPARNREALYYLLTSTWKNPGKILRHASEPSSRLNDPRLWPRLSEYAPWMMVMDLLTYLPDDILTKVDRASMGVSLEARVPLLDHRVVEFAWGLPMSMKIRDGQGKWLLRQVLYRYLPKELVERPKMGFAIPIDTWLRGSLRDWAESLLDEKRLGEEGFFEFEPIRKMWVEHLWEKRNWQHHLWAILMFEAWLEVQ